MEHSRRVTSHDDELPLAWLPGAVELIRALRAGADGQRYISSRRAWGAVAFEPEPGTTFASRIIREPAICSDPGGLLAPAIETIHFPVSTFELEAENRARSEGASRVGERHVVDALVSLLCPEPGAPL